MTEANCKFHKHGYVEVLMGPTVLSPEFSTEEQAEDWIDEYLNSHQVSVGAVGLETHNPGEESTEGSP